MSGIPEKANDALSAALIDGFPRGRARPVVTWRCAKSRHRLARVFLTPDGWLLTTDGFRVSPQEWFRRVDPAGVRDTEAVRYGGGIPGVRRVEGLDKVLPLAFGDWPSGVRFEVGCDCGATTVPLSDLLADCQRFRGERRSVERKVDTTSDRGPLVGFDH